MKEKILLLTIAVLCFATYASADSFYIFSSRAQQNPTGFFDWSHLGPQGNVIDSPVDIFPFPLFPDVLVGNGFDHSFVRVDEGCGVNLWCGNFGFGENLVWTRDPNVGIGGGSPFDMLFAAPFGPFLTPVGSVGFGIQADLYGPFTATVRLYDPSGNFLAAFTFHGNSFASDAGDELFIGIGDKTAVNIGAIVISTDSHNPLYANDFAIDDPSFTYTTTALPEPGTLVLLASGLLGLARVTGRKMGR